MQRHLEKTIEFNKQEEALAILGYNDEYLKILSDSFDSKIISRGDKVVVRGNNNEVLSIEKVFLNRGGKIPGYLPTNPFLPPGNYNNRQDGFASSLLPSLVFLLKFFHTARLKTCLKAV